MNSPTLKSKCDQLKPQKGLFPNSENKAVGHWHINSPGPIFPDDNYLNDVLYVAVKDPLPT